MTLTGALSARPQETEEAAPFDASITIDAALADGESSDQRSTLLNFGWAPDAPHGSFTSNPFSWDSLHLSEETLRQCSSAEGRQSSAGDDEESRRGKGGNKKVLRAVSCTQAVLKDGQKKIVSDLFNLQQALWHKLAWLNEGVEEVLKKPSYRPDVKQQDLLDDIEGLLNERLAETHDYIEEFKKEVDTDTSELKRGQRIIFKKLLIIWSAVERLYGCCGSRVPPNCREDEIERDGSCLGCSRGYTLHTDLRCYLFKKEKKTFNEAKRQCRDQGGLLATMTPDNKKIIFDFVDRQAGDAAWIGMTRTDSTNWKWEDGSPFTDLNLFQDTIFNEHNCGAASRMNSEDSWIDMPCTSKKNFVCQRDAEEVHKL